MNLICGINPVLEALASGSRHFDRLLIAKGLRNRRISDAISHASRQAVPLRFETRETLDRLAGGVPHQGVIAVVSPRPASSIEELLATARDPALFVVLDGVEDPRNLGAILRTAEGAGCDGVLLPDRHSAGLTETVNRASAGALEHVRLARIGNVVQAIEMLKARGVWVVGFDAAGTQRWDAVDCRRPVALVLGGEGKGIRRLVRQHCDHLVSLPLFGHVASLNVSVAAGIALYEVIRQRGVVPSHVKPIPPKPVAPSHVVGPAADDDEHDPGAHGPAGGHDRHDDDLEDEDPDVHVVGLSEEDPAWTGPTVLKASGFRRGLLRPVGRGRGGPGGKDRGRRPDQGRDRGRGSAGPGHAPKREGRREPVDGSGGTGEPGRDGIANPKAAPAPDEARRDDAQGKGRRGRRGRGRRGDGARPRGPGNEGGAGPEGGAPPEAGTGQDGRPGPARGPEAGTGPGPGAAGEGGAEGRRRRRRRRR